MTAPSRSTSVGVELRRLYKRYGATTVVEGLDLLIEPGEFVSLLGPSGCGKTTTLRAIAGLVQPDSGEILVGERVINSIPAHRRRLGLVAQNYALFPHMTVFENVGFGLKMRGVARAEIETRVRAALATVQLGDFGRRYPRQLSGGQQQRVALARCLVVEPDVLLLDEPLGALDKKLRDSMQVELKQMQRQVGVTTVFVTHDQEEALTMSDRIAVMHQGRLQQYGTPKQIYESPENRFVAEFVGVCNFLDCRVVSETGVAAVVGIEAGSTFEIPLPSGFKPRSAGRTATLALRPEKVMLDCFGHRREIGLDATVDAVVFVGTAVHVHARTDAGTKLIAYRQNDEPAVEAVAVGQRVRASWHPADVRLLRD